MKYFGFDTAYKKLYESLFDDSDDILNNNEIDNSDLYKDEEYIFEQFTNLYNAQDLSKYSIIEYPKFGKFKIYDINGIKYRFVSNVESNGKYILGYPKNIKRCGVFSYIINSQELIDFIMKYNIIIQCPNSLYDPLDVPVGVIDITYIFDDINIPYNFLNNFSIYKESLSKLMFNMGLVFNNCNIITEEFESLLMSKDFRFKRLKYVNLNNVTIKELNIDVVQDFCFEITNCNLLTDLNIIYRCNVDNASLLIKKCKLLKNVNILEMSRFVSLLKLNIDKCPNIDMNTLILPNHNTKSYTIQLDNDRLKLRAIKFRGDVVKEFYMNGKGKDFKYRYYNIGPNPHMYWL